MPRRSSSANHSAKEPSQRQLRVGELIRHALSEIVREDAAGDPVLMDAPITVSEVRPSPDLKQARIFVSVLGADADETALVVAALNKRAGHYRHAVDHAVKLKFSPRLQFVSDTLFDEAGHIDALLKSDKVRRDLEEGDDDPEGEA